MDCSDSSESVIERSFVNIHVARGVWPDHACPCDGVLRVGTLQHRTETVARVLSFVAVISSPLSHSFGSPCGTVC